LPTEAGYESLKAIRVQRETLSFDSEERSILNLTSTTNPDGSVRTDWDGSQANKVVKDVPIDEYCTNLFRKKLAETESKGKLTENMMSLYEKFVIMYK
jgi:hypothetical protein